MKRIETFLKVLLLAVMAVIGLWAYAENQEKARQIAVVDSFETHQTNSAYEFRIKFHNNTTNYEGLCIEREPADKCKRFSAGERHRFSTLGGLIIFPDSSDKYLHYDETKETLR